MNFRKQFEEVGTVVIPKEALPITEKEWDSLEKLYTQVSYERPEIGDTYEDMAFSIFRVKKPASNHIFSEPAFRLLNAPKMREFLEEHVGLSTKCCLDRCQMHIFEEGDFIARHVDSESCPTYEYTVSYVVNDDFEAGEFVTYGPVKKEVHKAKARSIIVTRSNIPHEVLPVKEGKRLTALCFFKGTSA